MPRPEKNEVDVYLEKLYDDYKDNPERVFDSIKEKIEPLSNDGEFIELCESYKGSYHAEFERYRKAPPEQQEAMEGYLNLLKMLSEPSFDSFCAYLENVVMAYMLIINRFQLDITKAHQIVEKKAREFYSPPQKHETSNWLPSPLFERENLPIPYSKAVSALAKMSSKGKKPDRITNTLAINERDVQLFLTGFDKLSGALGISTHKLLVAGLASFADANHIGRTEKGIELLKSPEYTISIPEIEYATLCGYDTKEHPTNTPEETEQEKKRAKMELDNFRKQVKRDLNILSHARISWTELIKKKPRNFENIAIIGTTGIKNGYIKMTFDAEFVKYLLQIPVLMQYSTALLSVDNRKSTAYTIGLKMSEHYHMLQNHETRTASRLKVETLLECTELPSIEEVRKSKKSWTERIKEPFETALDELFQKGVISDWYYCKAKGKLLTDNEAQNIPDFETWCSLNVEYTLKNPVDLSELIEKKRTEKESCKKKKVGRPRKEPDSSTAEPKRKRGRPKKTES